MIATRRCLQTRASKQGAPRSRVIDVADRGEEAKTSRSSKKSQNETIALRRVNAIDIRKCPNSCLASANIAASQSRRKPLLNPPTSPRTTPMPPSSSPPPLPREKVVDCSCKRSFGPSKHSLRSAARSASDWITMLIRSCGRKKTRS